MAVNPLVFLLLKKIRILYKMNNQLYVIGNNSKSQLGIGKQSGGVKIYHTFYEYNIPYPFNLKGNWGNVKEICCGSDYSMFLCEDGNLFGMGANNYGQLGLGEVKIIDKPTLIEKSVQKIYCGNSHSFYYKNNSFFGMGFNAFGQLGIGNNSISCFYKPILIKLNIKDIICGLFTTIFIMVDKTILGMGFNNLGQLGNIPMYSTDPTIIFTEIDNISRIYSGLTHTFILNEEGKLYACGNNFSGQLGLGYVKYFFVPGEVRGDFNKIVDVYCGDNHTFLRDDKNEFYCMGNNEMGQLGLNNRSRQYFPHIVELKNIKDIICRNNYSLFLDNNGLLSGIGYDEFRLFGSVNLYYTSEITKIDAKWGKAEKIVNGNNHLIIKKRRVVLSNIAKKILYYLPLSEDLINIIIQNCWM